jgi:hypothetical protein
VLLINHGFWDHKELKRSNSPEQKQFLGLVKNASKRSIWKSTTVGRTDISKQRSDTKEYLDIVRSYGIEIYDTLGLSANLTGDRSNWYIDDIHFKNLGYQIFNEKLVEDHLCQ